LVENIVMVSQEPVSIKMPKCRVLVAGPVSSQETLNLVLEELKRNIFSCYEEDNHFD